MPGYTPLFGEIVTSSIWNEDNTVRIVWITLMALADAGGNVYASIAGLAPVARVTIPECEKAITILSSPDKYSRSKEEEGKRIIEIEGGWHIVNHKKYRDKAKSRAEYMRQYRRKKEPKKEENKANTNINTHTNTNKLQNVTVRNRCYGYNFTKFWDIYPKKVGKGDASKSFEKIRPSEQLLQTMIRAVEQGIINEISRLPGPDKGHKGVPETERPDGQVYSRRGRAELLRDY